MRKILLFLSALALLGSVPAAAQGGPRPGFGGPRPQPSAAEVAARQRAQNASRLKSLRDIETNMRTLEGMPFIK